MAKSFVVGNMYVLVDISIQMWKFTKVIGNANYCKSHQKDLLVCQSHCIINIQRTTLLMGVTIEIYINQILKFTNVLGKAMPHDEFPIKLFIYLSKTFQCLHS